VGGVQSYPPGMLLIQQSTFNRNNISIKMQDYDLKSGASTCMKPAPPSSVTTVSLPISITGSLFTCRYIPYTIGSGNWASPSNIIATTTANAGYPLTSEYIQNSQYPSSSTNPSLNQYCNLRDHNISIKPDYGIYLSRTGATQVVNCSSFFPNYVSSTSYSDFLVGATGLGNGNVFDNLECCIYGTYSNIKAVNNIFQNTKIDNTNIQSGVGIYSEAPDVGDFRLYAGSQTNDGNKFIDCYYAISTLHLLTDDISYCTFRSSQQTNFSILNGNHIGKYGVYINSARMYNYNINHNYIYNVENGIYYLQMPCSGGTSVGSMSTGIYSAQMNINSNTFDIYSVAGNKPANQFNWQPIQVDALQPATDPAPNAVQACSPVTSSSQTSIEINYNQILTAFNGISVSGWSSVYNSSNTLSSITLNRNIHATYNNINLVPNNNLVGKLSMKYVGQTGIKFTSNQPSDYNSIFHNTISISAANTSAIGVPIFEWTNLLRV
jgi:hypothetical protein